MLAASLWGGRIAGFFPLGFAYSPPHTFYNENGFYNKKKLIDYKIEFFLLMDTSNPPPQTSYFWVQSIRLAE